MFVEILCGGYGCCSGKSVHTVMRGEQCEVSEAEGARLIGLGMAKAVPVAANAPEIVPVAAPGASEGNDTPGSETSQDSPETACLDSEQLHSIPRRKSHQGAGTAERMCPQRDYVAVRSRQCGLRQLSVGYQICKI